VINKNLLKIRWFLSCFCHEVRWIKILEAHVYITPLGGNVSKTLIVSSPFSSVAYLTHHQAWVIFEALKQEIMILVIRTP
jgi:hypothetical protein